MKKIIAILISLTISMAVANNLKAQSTGGPCQECVDQLKADIASYHGNQLFLSGNANGFDKLIYSILFLINEGNEGMNSNEDTSEGNSSAIGSGASIQEIIDTFHACRTLNDCP